MTKTALVLDLPVATDPFGRWLEQRGGCITMSCSLGIWTVEIAWCKLHSYSDQHGTHKETWDLRRSDADLMRAMSSAIEQALAMEGGTS